MKTFVTQEAKQFEITDSSNNESEEKKSDIKRSQNNRRIFYIKVAMQKSSTRSGVWQSLTLINRFIINNGLQVSENFFKICCSH